VKVEDWTQLHDIVVTSAMGLFTSIGLDTTYEGSAPQVDAHLSDTLALIGLGGQIRGSLVLSVPTVLLTQSHPTRITDPSDVTDWLMELANLLLGRIKTRLVSRGVKTELSTPLSVRAAALQLIGFPGMPVGHAFQIGGETIYVVFGAVGPDDVQLIPDPDLTVVRMGEVVLF
jgi:CheY-specific phosphatase CheX